MTFDVKITFKIIENDNLARFMPQFIIVILISIIIFKATINPSI